MRRRTAAFRRASWLAAAAAVAPALALAGCDDSVSPNDPAVGTYALVSYGGFALPAPFDIGLDIVDGSIVVRGDGTCRDEFRFRSQELDENDEGATQSTGESCTWTRTRSTLRFAWEGGSVTTALLDGNRLETEILGVMLVFER